MSQQSSLDRRTLIRAAGAGALEQLQDFVSGNARRIYGVTPPSRTVVLEKQQWVVPETYGEVVPFFAGRQLEWQVAEVR